jgi:hypothetical protein
MTDLQRYKIALNALFAIKRHMEIVTEHNKTTLQMSAVYQIATKAIEQLKDDGLGE